MKWWRNIRRKVGKKNKFLVKKNERIKKDNNNEEKDDKGDEEEEVRRGRGGGRSCFKFLLLRLHEWKSRPQ